MGKYFLFNDNNKKITYQGWTTSHYFAISK